LEDQCVITRQVTVAGGVFAPGHLGELTQLVPIGVSADRERAVEDPGPALVGGGVPAGRLLVPQGGVSGRVAQAHRGAGRPAGGRADGRRAGPGTPPGRGRAAAVLVRLAPRPGRGSWRSRDVVARAAGVRDRRDRHDRAGQPGEPDPVHQGGGHHGGTGYPQTRLLALVACGTRTLIDAVFGPVTSGETTYAAGWLIAAIAAIATTKADALVRVKTGRYAPALPVMRRHGDGSCLSRFGGVPRVVDARITITTTAGRRAGC